MTRLKTTEWFRLRAVFAVGVWHYFALELTTVCRGWPVVEPQAVLVFDIVVTGALYLIAFRGRREIAGGSTSDRP
jgi:hypothetical protein